MERLEEADTRSIEEVIATFYAAFDNRDGRRPDLDGLRKLFSPGATITRVSNKGVEKWTVDQFIDPRAALLTDGSLMEFNEWEVVGRNSAGAGRVSRWSEYEKSGILNGAEFHGGGTKAIQLQLERGAWVITSIVWQDREA